MRVVQPLDCAPDDLRAGGLSQQRQLIDRRLALPAPVLAVRARIGAQLRADEEGALLRLGSGV